MAILVGLVAGVLYWFAIIGSRTATETPIGSTVLCTMVAVIVVLAVKIGQRAMPR